MHQPTRRPTWPATEIGLNKALNRLSSGLRINSSGDDAAGLAVANSYRSNVAVLNQGLRNAGDGLSTLQIKDGALNNISNLIDRLATLATQSASSSSNVDRSVLDTEFQDVIDEIDREAAVAGLTTAQGFSVFVSNDSGNGTIGGSVGRGGQHRPLDHRSVGRDGDPGGDGGLDAGDLGGNARWRSGAGRHHSEPSAVRDFARAVADRQQHGSRKPHP